MYKKEFLNKNHTKKKLIITLDDLLLQDSLKQGKKHSSL